VASAQRSLILDDVSDHFAARVKPDGDFGHIPAKEILNILKQGS